MSKNKNVHIPKEYKIENVYMDGTDEEKAKRQKIKQQEIFSVLEIRYNNGTLFKKGTKEYENNIKYITK